MLGALQGINLNTHIVYFTDIRSYIYIYIYIATSYLLIYILKLFTIVLIELYSRLL